MGGYWNRFLALMLFGLIQANVAFAYSPIEGHSEPELERIIQKFLSYSQGYEGDAELAEDFENFISKLQASRSGKSDLLFAKNVFHRSQRKFLNRYAIHSSFGHLLYSGNYDCVSGSALLAIIYHALGFDVRIIESPFHVFLELEIEGRKVLIESTDPETGFISSPLAIQEFYKTQEKKTRMQLSAEEWKIASESVFRELKLEQLALLQMYNAAIADYNALNFMVAFEKMGYVLSKDPNDKALDFYERIFAALIQKGDLETSTLKALSQTYKANGGR